VQRGETVVFERDVGAPTAQRIDEVRVVQCDCVVQWSAVRAHPICVRASLQECVDQGFSARGDRAVKERVLAAVHIGTALQQ